MATHAYNSTSHGEQALAAALDEREVEYTREHKAVDGPSNQVRFCLARSHVRRGM